MKQGFIQVGVTALRNPDGSFQPSMPIYARVEDVSGINEVTGRTVAEDLDFNDFAKVIAEKFKEYKEAKA